MAEKEGLTIDGLESYFHNQETSVKQLIEGATKAQEARLSDWENKLKSYVKIDGGTAKEAEIVKKDDKKAELADSSMLSGIMDLKVMDVPLGQAIAGGFVAILGTELIDGFFVKQTKQVKGFIKLGGAFVAIKYGKKLLGNDGSKVVALLVAFDAIRDLTPIDEWANKLANKISAVVPIGGLGDQKGPPGPQERFNQWKQEQSSYTGMGGK